jgi:hypothetical protein
MRGANLLVSLVDRVRDDAAEGKPKYSGTARLVSILVPAKHSQTGETATVMLGGWASHPAHVPGSFKVWRAATVRVEQTLKSQDVDTEEVTDTWEVRDATAPGGLELQLQSVRKVGARTRTKGESSIISANDPALRQVQKFDAATDVVKSLPDGIDWVKGYAFRLTAPEYGSLFEGSERLIGISITPWYMRQVLAR